MVNNSCDEDGHGYATLVAEEFGVSCSISFFEVIEDKENQTREDQNIGQNSVVEQHTPTIVMDLDRDSHKPTKS